MDSLKNTIGKAYRSVAVNFMEVLKDSKFYTHGVLTPTEFVTAGDHLALKCPTWRYAFLFCVPPKSFYLNPPFKSWESGKESLRSKNLSPEKQYLITKNVPCPRRIKDLDTGPELAMEKGFGGNWMIAQATSIEKSCKTGAEESLATGAAGAVDIDDEEEKSKAEADALKEQFAAQTAKDIEELENESEPNVFAPSPTAAAPHDFYKTRTYDISITYDFYYQTPRLWLMGYSEKGELLSKEQMYEDIMSDYADKTVTLEQHPHQGIQCISIHPCKHAAVMKHIIDTMAANGKKTEIRQAMFVFLKFISSIIPTIEYDFTIDMELDSKK